MKGIGTDLVDVERFRLALDRTPTLADRLFSDEERAYAATAPDPAERLAARFAAKEAVMKALGVGLGAFALRDVEVVRAESGQPGVRLSGPAAALAEERGVSAWLVTLSHTTAVATATVVAL
ncbi:MAG TPA: holo-ACP synthase [Acidimicrobiales bacterium]|nr:holo-ACP synthase [Acidimicrobiales bacterium]